MKIACKFAILACFHKAWYITHDSSKQCYAAACAPAIYHFTDNQQPICLTAGMEIMDVKCFEMMVIPAIICKKGSTKIQLSSQLIYNLTTIKIMKILS